MPAKWELHLLCTRLIKQHPDWTDEQVMKEAAMRPLEEGIVAEARREVESETIPGAVTWDRSY